MPKAKKNSESKIAEAALWLAAKHDWSSLTLDQIAKAAKVPPLALKKNFRDKNALLPAVVRWISTETLAAFGELDTDTALHDRLFEVMMARIDFLQDHRRAILSIMEETRRNPSALRHLLPMQAEAMRSMLRAVGAEQKGFHEIFSVTGLLGIYVLTLYAWRTDSSSDMSKTMAALDRYLRRAGMAAEILFRTLP